MKEQNNSIVLVGTVVESALINDVYNGMKRYRGNFIMQVETEHGISLIPVSCYSNQMKKNGEESKQYISLDKLPIGSRIKVTGQLDENKMWNTAYSAMSKFTKIKFAYYKLADISEPDSSVFTFTGFVTQEIAGANADEMGVPADYVICAAEQDYTKTKLNEIKFNINKDETSKIEKMTQAYTMGKTINIKGHLEFDVATYTDIVEGDFGDEEVIKQRKVKRFVIDNGFGVQPDNVYDEADINTLTSGSMEQDKEIEAKAKNSSGSKPAAAKPMNNQTTTRTLI